VSGTFTTNTKYIDCPNCGKEVMVYWASFIGCGKKCPYCGKIISKDIFSHKLVATEPAK